MMSLLMSTLFCEHDTLKCHCQSTNCGFAQRRLSGLSLHKRCCGISDTFIVSDFLHPLIACRFIACVAYVS